MTFFTSGAGHRTLIQVALRSVTAFAVRAPVLTLMVASVLTAVSVVYTAKSLTFKTSRADLISPKSDYHQRWLKYTKSFGADTDDMVVAVEADDPAVIEKVLFELGPKVEADANHFKNVWYKVDRGPLVSKGLQYRDPRELQEILDQVEKYGPVLRGRWDLLALHQTLRGLRLQLSNSKGQPEAEAVVLGQIGQLIDGLQQMLAMARDPEAARAQAEQMRRMADAMKPPGPVKPEPLFNEDRTMGFLRARPAAFSKDFDGALPSIQRLRELIAQTKARYPNIWIGLTGIPVLESDEMLESQSSMTWAGVWSFVGVAVLLFWGFRGLRHPLLGLVLLGVGTAWSFGFTTLVVGHLNILSASFAAMLVGIGIDFAIVYLSRYLEVRHNNVDLVGALLDASETVGPGIVTAGTTGAVAFFIAVFSDFLGVAELGIIAGSGILICLFATFFVLPALLVMCDSHTEVKQLPTPFEGRWIQALTSKWSPAVIVASVVLIAGISTYGRLVKYDYNLLHMQSQDIESVMAQERIFKRADGSLLYAVSIANGPKQALELKQRFEALPTVGKVVEVASALPKAGEEETQLLVQAVSALIAHVPATMPQVGVADPQGVGEQFEKLEALLPEVSHPLAANVNARIGAFLDLLEQLPFENQVRLLTEFQAQTTARVYMMCKALAPVSNPEPVTLADLDAPLVSRFVKVTQPASDVAPQQALWLLHVYPKQQVWDIEPLEKFVADVRQVDPEVTGTPLQNYEALRDIFHSYRNSGLYALVAVVLLLLLDFRSLTDTVLAMLPPVCGVALMLGIMGMIHEDVNPANLIMIPLILGLGVDGGVHILHDFHLRQGQYRVSGSTINSIVLTATTSMVGFGSMMIAKHRGMYSLGLVLTIGVGCCMCISLGLLPAILSWLSRRALIRQHLSEKLGHDAGVVTEAEAGSPGPNSEGFAYPGYGYPPGVGYPDGAIPAGYGETASVHGSHAPAGVPGWGTDGQPGFGTPHFLPRPQYVARQIDAPPAVTAPEAPYGQGYPSAGYAMAPVYAVPGYGYAGPAQGAAQAPHFALGAHAMAEGMPQFGYGPPEGTRPLPAGYAPAPGGWEAAAVPQGYAVAGQPPVAVPLAHGHPGGYVAAPITASPYGLPAVAEPVHYPHHG